MKDYLRQIGSVLIRTAVFFYDYTVFSFNLIKVIFSIRSLNPAVTMVYFRQIYFTGVQILPTYSIIALVIGIAAVGGMSQFLSDFGAREQIGNVIVRLIIQELAPLVTVIMLTLRSSTAVTAEIAIMKMNHEIDTLYSLSIDPYRYLYLPRVIAGFISMLSLSIFFIFIAIIGGYAVIGFSLDISFDFLIRTIYDSLDFKTIAVYLFKTIIFGHIIMSIPIFSALEVKGAVTEIPIALIRGMLRLFYFIIIIEAVGALI